MRTSALVATSMLAVALVGCSGSEAEQPRDEADFIELMGDYTTTFEEGELIEAGDAMCEYAADRDLPMSEAAVEMVEHVAIEQGAGQESQDYMAELFAAASVALCPEQG